MTPKQLLTAITLPLALVLGGCASTPKPETDYKADYDFSSVSKIGFYDESGHVSGTNPVKLSDFQIDRVDNALSNALTAKGVQVVEDPAEADLLLSWHLVVEDKTDVRTYETPSYGVGYGRYGGYNRYSMYSCWNCSNTEVRVTNYTQGTFIVDLIDPKLQKSVWRSVTQSKLKGEQKADQDKYNEAAALIMGGFPPGAVN